MRITLLALLMGALGTTAIASSVSETEHCTIATTLVDGSEYIATIDAQQPPLLLKFWATWCGVCMQEMPDYIELHAEYGKDVRFLAVNVAVDDPRDHVLATIRDLELQMPVVYDETGHLWERLGVQGTPTYVLLGSDGRILFRSNGHSEELESAIRGAARLEHARPGDHASESI